jgi:RNA polymerase sigma-70 factor (ECF subfamily)
MARPVLGMAGRARRAPGASITRLDRDRSLVEAARRDPAQFDALYRRYLAQVYSFAYYELRDHHDAEDATERTFLAALAGLDRFEERARAADGPDASTFRIWLFRIARNAIADQQRQRRRHPVAPLEEAAVITVAGDVETAALRRDDASAAWDAIGRLPSDRRRAIVLRFVEDMSTAEIASVLGRSEGAIRVLIHRALRSVARDLGVGGETHGGPGKRSTPQRSADDASGR